MTRNQLKPVHAFGKRPTHVTMFYRDLHERSQRLRRLRDAIEAYCAERARIEARRRLAN